LPRLHTAQSSDISYMLMVIRSANWTYRYYSDIIYKQESPAIADKPARRESLPKLHQIQRAYNVVADNTSLSSCI